MMNDVCRFIHSGFHGSRSDDRNRLLPVISNLCSVLSNTGGWKAGVQHGDGYQVRRT